MVKDFGTYFDNKFYLGKYRTYDKNGKVIIWGEVIDVKDNQVVILQRHMPMGERVWQLYLNDFIEKVIKLGFWKDK